jgi:uncharacterized membrane protein
MSAGMRRAGRQPDHVFSGRSRHPLHPFLVHVPIGAWVCSLVFDIASRFDSTPAVLTRGSEWLIGIGILGAAAAAVPGFLDWAAIRPSSAAFRTASTHMAINLSVIFAYAGNFGWRLRHSPGSAPVNAGLIALSAGCVVALGVSGYLGGKLTYRYGVRVTAADERQVSAGPASR